MKYHQPGSLSEAASLLAEEADAKIIAGGQSMMPLLQQDLVSPDTLIDISRVTELHDRSVDVSDSTIDIGALVTYSELLNHEVCTDLELLRDALEAIGDVQVRNAGTIGGGIAHADPAQDLPPALQCYGASVVSFDGDDYRRHGINEFFVDFYFTALEPNEIVTNIEVTRPPAEAGGAFAKHARTPGGFSQAGVAVLLIPNGTQYADARVAYCAGAPVPRRAPSPVESTLTDGPITETVIREVADGVADSLNPVGDVGDNEAFTEHIFRVLTKRAIVTAAARSAGPDVEDPG